MFESTEMIGRRQFDVAQSLFETSDKRTLKGEVTFRHSFIDMTNCSVSLESGQIVNTCSAALGYGFGAGTTDGPGLVIVC